MRDVHVLMGSATTGATFWHFGAELKWQDRAACGPQQLPKTRVKSPDAFYPLGAPAQAPKALCLGCPVRQECLEWALAHDEQGTWGGLTKPERDALLIAQKGTK